MPNQVNIRRSGIAGPGSDVLTPLKEATEAASATATAAAAQAVEARDATAAIDIYGAVRSIASAIQPNPPVDTVQANGWKGTSPSLPGLPTSLRTLRRGFNEQGLVTDFFDGVFIGTEVRKAFPNQEETADNTLALGQWLRVEDYLTHAQMLSSLTSPKPICNWTMPSRGLVGNTAYAEFNAFHCHGRPGSDGKGRQIACGKVRATDGVNYTPWVTTYQTQVSAICEDAHSLEVYGFNVDTTSLDEGLCWFEGEAYPWVGSDASVLRSEDSSVAREFSRRYFLKDLAKAAAPPFIYVASTGDNSTGVVSTDAAVAKATPCLTVAGALARATAQLGSADGALDGLRIRIVDTVSQGAVSYAFHKQQVAAVVIEKDPDVTRPSAVLEYDVRFNPNFRDSHPDIGSCAIRYHDLSIEMKGNLQMDGNAGHPLIAQFHDVSVDFAGFSFLRSTSHFEVFGMVAINWPTGSFQPFNFTSAGQVRLLRGLVADIKGKSLEAWITLGCSITASGSPATADSSVNGHIWQSNSYWSPAALAIPLLFNGSVSGGDLGSFAVSQNLVEPTDISNRAVMRFSGDSNFGNITHAVVIHNTTPGVGIYGRWNIFYDEHPTVARYHTNICFKGNVGAQLNTKGDIFVGTSGGQPTVAPDRLGQFEFTHGVGCEGNWTMYAANAPSSEHQYYPGPGSQIAAGDPGFTDYRAVGGTPTSPVAGSGGGDYRLLSEAPGRGILSEPLLAFDLEGSDRGTDAQAVGCYA